MLAQHLGFCPECFSTHYTDIATDHGFSDADTAKRVCERALIKLLKNIIIFIEASLESVGR